MTKKRSRKHKDEPPRKKQNNMEQALEIIDQIDQKISENPKTVFKDEEKVLSILTPEILNKIQKKSNSNEKIKEIDHQVSLILQNSQLFTTAIMIRDYMKQKKRTAIYKKDLIHEIYLLQKSNRSETDIHEEFNLLILKLPEFFQTCISPTEKVVFKIVSFDIAELKKKLGIFN